MRSRCAASSTVCHASHSNDHSCVTSFSYRSPTSSLVGWAAGTASSSCPVAFCSLHESRLCSLRGHPNAKDGPPPQLLLHSAYAVYPVPAFSPRAGVPALSPCYVPICSAAASGEEREDAASMRRTDTGTTHCLEHSICRHDSLCDVPECFRAPRSVLLVSSRRAHIT